MYYNNWLNNDFEIIFSFNHSDILYVTFKLFFFTDFVAPTTAPYATAVFEFEFV